MIPCRRWFPPELSSSPYSSQSTDETIAPYRETFTQTAAARRWETPPCPSERPIMMMFEPPFIAEHRTAVPDPQRKLQLPESGREYSSSSRSDRGCPSEAKPRHREVNARHHRDHGNHPQPAQPDTVASIVRATTRQEGRRRALRAPQWRSSRTSTLRAQGTPARGRRYRANGACREARRRATDTR